MHPAVCCQHSLSIPSIAIQQNTVTTATASGIICFTSIKNISNSSISQTEKRQSIMTLANADQTKLNALLIVILCHSITYTDILAEHLMNEGSRRFKFRKISNQWPSLVLCHLPIMSYTLDFRFALFLGLFIGMVIDLIMSFCSAVSV